MDDSMSALLADPVPAVIPPAYQAAAKAKAKRDAASYAAFRAVDQARYDRAHRERVDAEVSRWAEEVRLYGEDIAELAPEAATALAASRAAEDRAREGAESARARRLEYERARAGDRVSADEETEALLRADAAEETLHRRREAATAAAGESRLADAALAEAREGLAGAERELARARERAAVPAGEAAVSDVTMRACSAYMQRDEVWETLSDRDRFRVRQAGEPRDMVSPAQWQAMLRDALGGERTAV